MKTTRLKGIVIVILLLVNVFLLFLLLSRRAEENAGRERAAEQLVTLFAGGGITLDPSLLPQNETIPSAESARSEARETAFAERLLSDVTMLDSGGGVSLYTGAEGQCSIRSGGAVDAELSRAVDDPEDFCRKLFRDFGYRCTDTQLSGGSGTVTGVRCEDELLVFNASLTLSFSRGTLTGASGTLLPTLEEGRRSTGVDAFSALVHFFDYRNLSGAVCTRIVSVDSGYLLQSSAAAPLKLLPVWRITTDVNSYYVNYNTGEITRE